MKTPIQQAIDHLTKEGLKTGNSNRDVIAYLESQLENEKEAFINFGNLAQLEGYALETGDMDEAEVHFYTSPKKLFTQRFETED